LCIATCSLGGKGEKRKRTQRILYCQSLCEEKGGKVRQPISSPRKRKDLPLLRSSGARFVETTGRRKERPRSCRPFPSLCRASARLTASPGMREEREKGEKGAFQLSSHLPFIGAGFAGYRTPAKGRKKGILLLFDLIFFFSARAGGGGQRKCLSLRSVFGPARGGMWDHCGSRGSTADRAASEGGKEKTSLLMPPDGDCF